MKIKKIISVISVLAISISAFAGMAITASAYTTTDIEGYGSKIVEDFETSQPFNIKKVSADRWVNMEDDANADPLQTGKMFGVYHGHPSAWEMDETLKRTADTRVEMDFKMDFGGAKNSKGSTNTIALSNSITVVDTWAVTSVDDILNVSMTSATNYSGSLGTFTINGEAAETNNVQVWGSSTSKYRTSKSGITDRGSTGWLHMTADLDFTNKKVYLEIYRISDGKVIFDNTTTGIDFVSVNATALQGMYIKTGGNGYGGTYLDNIVIKDIPVATSLQITGADEVKAGAENVEYAVAIADQYGDIEDFEKTVTLETVGTLPEGVTFADGKLSVASTAAKGATITLQASAEDMDSVTKTVTIPLDKGYILTTTPYSIITIDEYIVVNSGNTGVVELDESLADSGVHSVEISKPGYTTVTQSIELPINQSGTYTLTPSTAGVTYYEDFSLVNDTFGFSDSVRVNDGIFKVSTTDKVIKNKLPLPIDITDKLTTIKFSINTIEKNARLYLLGTDETRVVGAYFRVGEIRVNEVSGGPKIASGTYYELQFYTPSEGKLIAYLNGKKVQEVVNASGIIAGIELGGSGGTNGFSIDEITISDMPTTNDVTVVDGETTSATKYLTGSTATLPENAAANFLGYAVGESTEPTLESGASVIVTADVTYTAIYDPTTDATCVMDITEGSSLWKATITGTDVAYNKITATVTPDEGEAKAVTADAPTISGPVDVSVYIAVNKAKDAIASVAVSTSYVVAE